VDRRRSIRVPSLLAYALIGCAEGSDATDPNVSASSFDAATALDASSTQRQEPAPADAANGPAVVPDASEVAPALDAGVQPIDARAPDESGEALPEDVRSLAEHACLHARNGPFRDLTFPTPEATAPEVNRPHTAYRLHASTATATVAFVAPLAGSYVIMSSEDATPLAAASGAPSTRYDTSEACELLPSSSLRQLHAGERLELTYQPFGSVLLVVERLEPATDAQVAPDDATSPPHDASADGSVMCRSSGWCSSDAECCAYCHDYDHCH
jgi:hypothetical protein